MNLPSPRSGIAPRLFAHFSLYKISIVHPPYKTELVQYVKAISFSNSMSLQVDTTEYRVLAFLESSLPPYQVELPKGLCPPAPRRGTTYDWAKQNLGGYTLDDEASPGKFEGWRRFKQAMKNDHVPFSYHPLQMPFLRPRSEGDVTYVALTNKNSAILKKSSDLPYPSNLYTPCGKSQKGGLP